MIKVDKYCCDQIFLDLIGKSCYTVKGDVGIKKEDQIREK